MPETTQPQPAIDDRCAVCSAPFRMIEWREKRRPWTVASLPVRYVENGKTVGQGSALFFVHSDCRAKLSQDELDRALTARLHERVKDVEPSGAST